MAVLQLSQPWRHQGTRTARNTTHRARLPRRPEHVGETAESVRAERRHLRWRELEAGGSSTNRRQVSATLRGPQREEGLTVGYSKALLEFLENIDETRR